MTAHGVETPILAACLCGDDPQLQVARRQLGLPALPLIEAAR